MENQVDANNSNPEPVRAAQRDIVMVGASAGGLKGLKFLLGRLSQTSLASFFVVIHTAAHDGGSLAEVLQRASHLSVISPRDGDPIRPGQVYVAIPDHHLVVESGRVRLLTGPREHGHRPSIDALFQSAAKLYESRVTGILLSGALSDGVSGLAAVKQFGGLTIVQAPHEALFPGMSQAAIAKGVADHSVPLSQILIILRDHCPGFVRLTEAPRGPHDIGVSPRGEPVAPHRALRTAARLLDDHGTLLRRLAGVARQRGQDDVARHYEDQARDRDLDAAALREFLGRAPESRRFRA